MVSQKYRWDFIGLSTDDKPTSETSDKVVNGSTYYCSDTSKLYVYCDGTWYERKPLGGGGGGGTSDFNDLSNRPKYNGTDMTGSTNIPEVVTYSNFTGTDGTTAGTAGLVPAPIATDTDKYLKSDGTWARVSGGGTTYTAGDGIDITNDVISATNTGKAKELTTADYNANSANWADTDPTNFNCVALWKLDSGIYHGDTTAAIPMYIARNNSVAGSRQQTFIIGKGPSQTMIMSIYDAGIDSSSLINVTGSDGNTNTYQSNRRILFDTAISQSTGSSTDSVMSQNAVTSMVYADPGEGILDNRNIRIGNGATSTGNSTAIGAYAKGQASSIVITNGGGNGASATGARSIAIGDYVSVSGVGAVSIGAWTPTNNVQGKFEIGTTVTDLGYNNSNYRLLTGLYDPQSAHDAATKGYVDGIATMGILTTSPTGTTAGVPGRLYTLDTGGGTYEVYLCVHDNGDDTYVWKQVSLI